MNGKLIVFSAPSGSGKTTIVHHLLEQEDLNLAFSVSVTSREKRGDEIDAKDYYFISNEQFQKYIEEDKFVEWEEVYKGTKYGTLTSEIERLWKAGKNVIFDIDVVGGLNIKKQFPEETLAVFVKPPSVEELKKRLEARGTETSEKIQMRLDKAEKELSFASDFDTILINDNLEKAKKTAKYLIKGFLYSE
jgi:guanylate kinase